ncbi:MAG: DEAD/DEAH box helicase, partial [Candidatus Nanopelagicales bacterium]
MTRALPLLAGGRRGGRSGGGARHVEQIPAREGRSTAWPEWTPEVLRERLIAAGITAPWEHQAAAAESAHGGRHTVLATGTASGKTLALWLPALSDIVAAEIAVSDSAVAAAGQGATALYLSPTKALAHDQFRALQDLAVPGLRVATYDGDTPADERRWVRAHAHYVLSNPDLVHRSLLPRHTAWARFLRGLRYVIIDEAHHYRGMFGSHVAMVVRRLLRVASHYGAHPTVILASATMATPEATAQALVGAPVAAITEDASPRSPLTAVLWEPPEAIGIAHHAEGSQPRRSAIAESADLLADLVSGGTRTLAFVPSRRGVET